MKKINPYESVLENLEYKLQNELDLNDERFLELKKGTFKMDYKTAQYLEGFLGGASSFWTNLYNNYQNDTRKL